MINRALFSFNKNGDVERLKDYEVIVQHKYKDGLGLITYCYKALNMEDVEKIASKQIPKDYIIIKIQETGISNKIKEKNIPLKRPITRKKHDDYHHELNLSKNKDNKVSSVLIPLEEYKELLITKGMYQEQNRCKIVVQMQSKK